MDFGAALPIGLKSLLTYLTEVTKPLRAVELPLTSLADDVERTRKMIAQSTRRCTFSWPLLWGVVITEVGNQPNVVGLDRICKLLHPMLVKVQVALPAHLPCWYTPT